MVFADTSGFVAAFDARDAHHPRMAETWRALAGRGERLVTTQLVFAETVTHLRRRAGWEISRRVGETILASRALEIVHLGADHLAAAWTEFVRSGDPRLSLCDAASFVIMRERGIERALTTDRYFSEAGFRLLP